MQRLYLIRHGMPEFPGGEKHCIGQTDLPISLLGRLQGCLLGAELAPLGLRVFTSPLSRAEQTAKYISPEPVRMDGLKEMYAGDWDGLSFSEIRSRWGELFKARGEHPEIPIPGSEDLRQGQKRFMAAVRSALDGSEGDVAVVAHSTVNQSLICASLCQPPERGRSYRLRCGSYSILDYDSGSFTLRDSDILPHPMLNSELCAALLTAANCGERIQSHCAAVAREAERIALALAESGLRLDLSLIRAAAAVHDIARGEDRHARRGAELLAELGYPSVAQIIARHHDLEGGGETDEAAVVYIADKCVAETERVPLELRFQRSREKCSTPEALAAHQRRYEEAVGIKNKINSICDKEIIQ